MAQERFNCSACPLDTLCGNFHHVTVSPDNVSQLGDYIETSLRANLIIFQECLSRNGNRLKKEIDLVKDEKLRATLSLAVGFASIANRETDADFIATCYETIAASNRKKPWG